MSKRFSPVLAAYAAGFQVSHEPFLHSYVCEGAAIQRQVYSRDQIWQLARKAAGAMRAAGCGRGDRVIHVFGANQVADVVIRLAAAMTGIVPVTINWQADSLERVRYKIELTNAQLAWYDDVFAPALRCSIAKACPELNWLHIEQDLAAAVPLEPEQFVADLHEEETRVIIFTSGTTGEPKGVQLPYRSYATNHATFEAFLNISAEQRLAMLIVNPMHHTNSTAITDWAMRRPGSVVHLVQRYSTLYWRLLAEVAEQTPTARLIAPVVARHFDFLQNLADESRLPIAAERLKAAMRQTCFLIGSAPVGPTTIERLRNWTGRIPEVRFGSTETCLQVIGMPAALDEAARLQAFQCGWEHRINGELQPGYFIGRPHHPYTEARVVRSVTVGSPHCMLDCLPGQPGYLVTRGGNLMSGYTSSPEATAEVFIDGWYIGLKDICFTLTDPTDGMANYYWMSRESSLLIRGGANYAYDQINAELTAFACRHYDLRPEQFELSVVGLRVDSEHEDACCVTLEFSDTVSAALRNEVCATFITAAAAQVSKGGRPDYLRLAPIPRNFKGAVLVPELQEGFRQWLARAAAVATSSGVELPQRYAAE